MGPANTKISVGRADATLALRSIVETVCDEDNVKLLSLKYQLLTDEEKDELSEILGVEEDLEDLLQSRAILMMFFTEFDETE